jgi:hypothetical protein
MKKKYENEKLTTTVTKAAERHLFLSFGSAYWLEKSKRKGVRVAYVYTLESSSRA